MESPEVLTMRAMAWQRAKGELQALLATYWPVFNEVQLDDGRFNAIVDADITQNGIGELHIKQFEALVRVQYKKIIRRWHIDGGGENL